MLWKSLYFILVLEKYFSWVYNSRLIVFFLFFQSFKKNVAQCLLSSIISKENPAVILVFVLQLLYLQYVMCHFPPWLILNFSIYHCFKTKKIMMNVSVFYACFLCSDPLTLILWVYILYPFWKMLCGRFYKYFFCPSSLSSVTPMHTYQEGWSSPTAHYTHFNCGWWWLWVVVGRDFYTMFSGSLILFSIVSNLLLLLSSLFFISNIIMFLFSWL